MFIIQSGKSWFGQCFITIFLQFKSLYIEDYIKLSMKSLSAHKLCDIVMRKLGFYALLGWFNR